LVVVVSAQKQESCLMHIRGYQHWLENWDKERTWDGRSPKNTVRKRVDKTGQMVDPCLRNEPETHAKQGEKDAGPD